MVVTVNNKEGEPLREPEKALGEDHYVFSTKPWEVLYTYELITYSKVSESNCHSQDIHVCHLSLNVGNKRDIQKA